MRGFLVVLLPHIPQLAVQGLGGMFFSSPFQLPPLLPLLCSMLGSCLACSCRPFALGLLLGFSTFSTARKLEARGTMEVRASHPPDCFLLLTEEWLPASPEGPSPSHTELCIQQPSSAWPLPGRLQAGDGVAPCPWWAFDAAHPFNGPNPDHTLLKNPFVKLSLIIQLE